VAGVTLLCASATLLNPVGINAWRTVLHSASDPLIRKIIMDWVPLPKMLYYDWQTSPIQMLQLLIPLALFSGFFVSLAVAPMAGDAALTAVAAVFIGGAPYALRNTALAVIALAIPMAHHLGVAVTGRASAESDAGLSPIKNPPSLIVLGIVIIRIAAVGGLLTDRLATQDPVPKEAVAFMKERGLHGNILNHLPWGAYLIWHLAPPSHIFIDGRAEEIYSDSLMRAYGKFYYDQPDGKSLLGNYPHDFILLKPGTAASHVVAADPNWKVVYRDNVAVLFARASARIEAEHGVRTSARVGRYYFP
jgi:hypothetical protein